MARCAVCYQEFDNGEKIGMQDEFVVHRRCAGGRPQIAKNLETEIRQNHERRYELERAIEERRRLTARNDLLQERVTDLSDSRRQQDHLIDDLRQEVRRECRTRDETIQELRQQLAAERAKVGQPQEITPADERDATEQRFALLELD